MNKYTQIKWSKKRNQKCFLKYQRKWHNERIIRYSDNNEIEPSTSGKPNLPTKVFKDSSDKNKKFAKQDK